MDIMLDFQEINFECTEVYKHVYDLKPLATLTESQLFQLVLKDIQYLVMLTQKDFMNTEVTLHNQNKSFKGIQGALLEINQFSHVKVIQNSREIWININDYLRMAYEAFNLNVRRYLIFVESFQEENPSLLKDFSQNEEILSICKEIGEDILHILELPQTSQCV